MSQRLHSSPRTWWATVGGRWRAGSVRRTVARTTVFNLAATVAGAVTGIIVARELGATVRGEYAAIMVWFSVVTQLGQLGQTTATTYYVAREPARGRDYLATSRTLMLLTGSVTLTGGMLAAPLLASSDTVAWGHRLMFATCLAAYVGASYTFSLLARDTARWNVVRVAQPVGFLALVVLFLATGVLDLVLVLAAFAVTTVGQTVLAYVYCRRLALHRGRPSRALARPLARYGFGHLAAAVPRIVASRADQLVLSLAVVPAALGNYAVAVTLVTLTTPVASALGSVVFPKLASRTLSPAGTARLQRRTLLAAGVCSVGLVGSLVAVAPWLVPLLFGAGFADAVTYAFLLAPAGVFLACGKVCEGLLRGHGRPYAVARAQAVAAVVMVALLAGLVPLWQAPGAAVAASVAAGVALVVMGRALHRSLCDSPSLSNVAT